MKLNWEGYAHILCLCEKIALFKPPLFELVYLVCKSIKIFAIFLYFGNGAYPKYNNSYCGIIVVCLIHYRPYFYIRRSQTIKIWWEWVGCEFTDISWVCFYRYKEHSFYYLLLSHNVWAEYMIKTN